eukprot:484104-Prorocentrum_lima.AAC.1
MWVVASTAIHSVRAGCSVCAGVAQALQSTRCGQVAACRRHCNPLGFDRLQHVGHCKPPGVGGLRPMQA